MFTLFLSAALVIFKLIKLLNVIKLEIGLGLQYQLDLQ